MAYFKPIAGQLHVNCTATPSTPVQFTYSNGSQLNEAMVDLRVLIFNASGSSEVHMAYGQSSAIVTAIAGAGGDTTAGVQDAGIITFGAAPATYYGGQPDYISIPSGSFISVWCAVAAQTADVYICPGQERTH